MKPTILLGTLALLCAAAAAADQEPECKLANGKSHAAVAGQMHKPTDTCREFAQLFSPEASCAIPPGYRRPKAGEVTPLVGKKAVEWLNKSPSDQLWLTTEFDDKGRHYKLRTEYHCHNPGERGPQGWHKGVTVYVKK